MNDLVNFLRITRKIFSSKSIEAAVNLGALCALTGLVSAISPYALSLIVAKISSADISERQLDIFLNVGLYVLCLIMPRFLNAYADYGQSMLRLEMIKELSERYFEKLCGIAPSYFQHKNMGYLSQQLNQVSNEFYSLVRVGLTSLITPSFQLLVSIGFLLAHKNYLIVSACICYGAAFGYLTNAWASDLSEKKLRLMDAGRNSYSILVDSIQNITAIRQYGSASLLEHRYEQVLNDDKEIQKNYWRSVLWEMLVNNGLFLILFGVCFVAYVAKAINGEIPVSEVVMAGAYIMALSAPLEALAGSFSDIKQSSTAISEFVAEESLENGIKPSSILKGYDCVINDLAFKYSKEAEVPTLAISQLLVPEGAILGVTGPSGSGKSTLLKLLTCEETRYSGSLMIGGVELAELSTIQSSSLIGIVRQDAAIFQDTLRFNMQIAAPHADDQQILDALRMAGLGDFIASLTNGLETAIGDRGATISGGQRQRLSLARLFLTKPKIVILDESTSSLDVENEAYILNNAIEYFKGCTIVLVSHRSSVLKYASHIAVLEDGHISSAGTVESVAAESDYYSKVIIS